MKPLVLGFFRYLVFYHMYPHLSSQIGGVELDGDEVDEDKGGGGAKLSEAVDEQEGGVIAKVVKNE